MHLLNLLFDVESAFLPRLQREQLYFGETACVTFVARESLDLHGLHAVFVRDLLALLALD